MLIQFTFSNFKCFREENTFNMVSLNTKHTNYYAHKTPFKYSILKTAAVFGANASGKTKFFEAVNFMRNVICPPVRDEKIPVYDYWQTKYDPFRLNQQSENSGSSFEMVFLLNEIQYRYGFTINKNGILSEWLYKKKNRETLILSRQNGKEYYISRKYINIKIFNNIIAANMVSASVPLLSILATFNDPLSKDIVNWFNSIVVISANDMNAIGALVISENKKIITSFLKAFDINIEDITLHETTIEQIPDKIKAIIKLDNFKGKFYDGINTTHKVYNEYYERVSNIDFSLEKDESFGTNRLFRISWPIIDSLKRGTVLFIDEIDSGIHTNIVKIIITLYYLCNTTAQLVINTQNASLLSASDDNEHQLFRKDQIYLVNKNRYGESSVLPATDFRNDFRSNLEKLYLNGDMTGVPYVDMGELLNIVRNN